MEACKLHLALLTVQKHQWQRDTGQRQIECSVWGYTLEPVNIEPGHLWLKRNGLVLRLELELAQN